MARADEDAEPVYRSLPSVDRVLRSLKHLHHIPQTLLVDVIRDALNERRGALAEGQSTPDAIEQAVEERMLRLIEPSLRRVINATGVILHTNLGRAPLAHFKAIPGYSNLEYDLAAGKRGKRDAHTSLLLERLLHRPAVVVNNNAAAVYLVLHELAAGKEVIVSRGELIEIGDGFRIPEIMARSQAILREVGTTNRTTVDDYRGAINERTALIMRVHPSNFEIRGFTARPSLHELAELGRSQNIPVYEDLGSGCLVDLGRQEIGEPLVGESLKAGINVVSFSCDKLLGGPQSGIIAGDATLVARIRRNPMYRAFRCDKLIVQALETMLRCVLLEDWASIPTLAMIFATSDELRVRALRIKDGLKSLSADVRESVSPIGGGSTPEQTLATWLVELTVHDPVMFERKLRRNSTPVIARIERDKIVLDMRTILSDEEEILIAAVRELLVP